MAYPSKLQQEPLRFTVPRDLQRFDLFLKLPYDIRYMIWKEVMRTPGIHFLKFEETLNAPTIHGYASVRGHSSESLVTSPEGRAEVTRNFDTCVYSATLKPIFPFSCADNSHYITKDKTLAHLRDSCSEAKTLVEKELAQPENLSLDNGQLVLLRRSSDVLCIDYPDMIHGRYLGRWSENLNLDQLAKVRRLAVRYHHEWDNHDQVCSLCGRVHSSYKNQAHPRHVYEFAALFKNLEEFYFIDYLTIRKSPCSPYSPCQEQDPGAAGERFATGDGGRTYFEVNLESCKTHTWVYETLAWIRNNYIAHCMSEPQGPPLPEKVRFKVLGCEWEPDQKLSPPKRPATQTTPPARKKRSRNHILNPATSSQRIYGSRFPTPLDAIPSQDGYQEWLPEPPNTSTLPVVFGDAGNSNFDFTLKVDY
ncbi:hypothetical protein F4678DRAFT_464883 [Xylaria arbuscula]|nr:hypothetical protein F4678DRAFT_464883 [Xylaria arbuscula]